ncbi:MAG: tripartite tricarboxylate transporter substrate binding protein [Betaproteobacteria bacterium]|nr:tripartite tricarboxylate transporter substrate binding protein [Betaproteobacteria bacterium]
MLTLVAMAGPDPALAQGYPVKPIRIIVSVAAGGGVDTTARIVAQQFQRAWGQQVVVENRPGAGGTIAAEAVAQSAADGHTLLMASSGHASTATLYEKLPYDAVKDFAAVSLVAVAPSVLVVHPTLPVKSVKDLITLAKARPGEVLFASSGNGSPAHMGMSLLQIMTGVQMVHVPYRGTAPSIIDLVAGRVWATASSVVSTMPHVKAGRLRALAVTSGQRSLAVPDLPTVAQAGVPGFANDVWYALFAPAATPRGAVTAMHEEIARSIAQPELRARMIAAGLEPVGNSPEVFSAYFRAEVAKWAKVIRSAGISIN